MQYARDGLDIENGLNWGVVYSDKSDNRAAYEYRIHVMRNTPRVMGRAGFTLVELMIVVSILGILAALVIPKFTNASVSAQSAATLDTLRSTRTSLERYKLDHNDSYPAIGDLWAALTGKTDLDGTINASGDYGPYLKSSPINPYTNSSTVAAFAAGDATDGWEYDTSEQPALIAVGFDEAAGTYTAP
jgi:type II secretion system protein G